MEERTHGRINYWARDQYYGRWSGCRYVFGIGKSLL